MDLFLFVVVAIMLAMYLIVNPDNDRWRPRR